MGRGKGYCFTTAFILYFLCGSIAFSYAFDKPCAARARSDTVDCVCNASYCDEVTREIPAKGTFIAYTTTKSGQRFSKTKGSLTHLWLNWPCTSSIYLDPTELYQSIEGFGGAVSDSSAALWVNLTDPQLKKHLIHSYFSRTGIEYNMVRLPIGASDYSPNVYTYQDQPENDPTLSNFTLSDQDYLYKIPMLHAALNAATAPVNIVGSLWGSPLWMKTKHVVSGVARVKEEYYSTLALYHYKFLEHYAAVGIPIWALTTPNEPLSGIMSLGNNFRVTWTVGGLGKWVVENLGPIIRNSTYKDVKIIIGDDQRMTVGLWFNLVNLNYPKALEYVDGVGVHFYFDDFTPPEMLTVPLKGYEDKFVIYTEASIFLNDTLSAWERAKKYTLNIIENLNYNVTGFIDWNMCLNTKGGPSWSALQLDSAVIISLEEAEFAKRPTFYALGHFAKFLPRGSRRISKVEIFPDGLALENVAFLTPNNTIVTILHNGEKSEHSLQIKVGYRAAFVTLAPESITTVEISL